MPYHRFHPTKVLNILSRHFIESKPQFFFFQVVQKKQFEQKKSLFEIQEREYLVVKKFNFKDFLSFVFF